MDMFLEHEISPREIVAFLVMAFVHSILVSCLCPHTSHDKYDCPHYPHRNDRVVIVVFLSFI